MIYLKKIVVCIVGCVICFSCAGKKVLQREGVVSVEDLGPREIRMDPVRVELFFRQLKVEKKDDSALVREQINNGSSYMKYLFAKYSKIHPDLGGKVDVELVVDEFGKVESCKVVYSSLGVDEMVDSIVGFLRGMEFKGLATGGLVVGYQFFF